MNRFNSIKKRSGERDKDKKAARITKNLANMSFTMTNKMEMPPKELPITPDMGGGVAMCELLQPKGECST